MKTYNNAPSDRVVINCSKCLNKLRVPTNVGKVEVTCPVCNNKFKYNPNSLLTSLKYAGLFLMSKIPKDRKTRLMLITGLLLIIIALWLLFASKSGLDNKPKQQPSGNNDFVVNYIEKVRLE